MVRSIIDAILIELRKLKLPFKSDLHIRYLLRQFAILSVYVSAFLLIVAYISKAADNPADKYTVFRAILSGILPAFHISYLVLVANMFVLTKPIETTNIREIWLSSLLGITYFFYSLGYLLPSSSMSNAAIGSFLLLYFLWLSLDLSALRRSRIPRIRKRHFNWIIVDSIAIVIIIFSIWQPSVFQYKVLAISVNEKDIIVGVCLFAVIIFRTTDNAFTKDFDYVNLYSRFLNALPPGETEWIDQTAQDKLSEILTSGNAIRVLDVGSANGMRGLSFLRHNGMPKNITGEYWGLEPNLYWGTEFEDFTRNFDTKLRYRAIIKSEFKREMNSDSPELFDIIILSHVLYTKEGTASVSDYVKWLTSSGIIIVRGYATKSYFWLAARERARDVFFKNMDAFWVKCYLESLVEKNRLQLMTQCDELLDCPSAVEKVMFDLGPPGTNDNSRMETLCDVIELIYGTRTRGNIEALMNNRFSIKDNLVSLPDLIYVFQQKQTDELND